MFNLFKNKIVVTFINNSTGKTIGISKMTPEQLPQGFDKPTTIQLQGKEWQVMNASPIQSVDFINTKELTLSLRPIEQIDPENIRFSLPTISNELPAMNETQHFNEFILELHEDDWRQIEFLPLGLLPRIKEEMIAVEKILFPENATKTFAGFESVHVRKLERNNLAISFTEFCESVNVLERGTFAFTGHSGFVQDSFALRSKSYMYYGTMNEGIIKELCVQQFDFADDEFSQIAGQYKLVLVAWCQGQIATV